MNASVQGMARVVATVAVTVPNAAGAILEYNRVQEKQKNQKGLYMAWISLEHCMRNRNLYGHSQSCWTQCKDVQYFISKLDL